MNGRVVVITETGKICTRCDRDLSLSEFYTQKNGTLGLKSECISCWAIRVRKIYESTKKRRDERNSAWRKANPDRMAVITRRSNLRRKYGISPEDYDAMLNGQNGQCAGCGGTDSGDRRFDKFHVDHDHQSGKIRGLLCAPCNRALGVLNDDPDRMMALTAYLLQYSDLLGDLIGVSA